MSAEPGDGGDTGRDPTTTTGGSTSESATSDAEASTAGLNSEGGDSTTAAETTSTTEPGESSAGMVDPCEDGVRNGDETDVDCGGACGGCQRCEQCNANADCVDSCLDGQCVEEIGVIVDHEVNCGEGPAVTVELPEGTYLARATAGAASIWGDDDFNDGLTWRWQTSCDSFELSDMRSMPLHHATPELAFEAIEEPEVSFYSPGETLTCISLDENCDDNRGAVMFSFFALCSE